MAKKKATAKAARKGAQKAQKAIKKTGQALSDLAANRKAQTARRASEEWTKKAHQSGERVTALPAKPQTGLKWMECDTDEDRQRWRGLVGDGCGTWVEFECWPGEDRKKLAHEKAVELYGVYAQDWIVMDIQPINEAAQAVS